MHQATSRAGGGFTLLEVLIAFDTGAVMIVTIQVRVSGMGSSASRTEIGDSAECAAARSAVRESWPSSARPIDRDHRRTAGLG